MDSKAGTFNAYLEYAQRGPSSSAPRPSAPVSLLTVLTQFPPEGATMSQLADLSGMSAPSFRDAMKKLSDAGFIEISGQPLSEVVKLTEKGRDTASLL